MRKKGKVNKGERFGETERNRTMVRILEGTFKVVSLQKSGMKTDKNEKGVRYLLKWPEWWKWELELTPHLFERMLDRGFSEIDLRLMLEEASGLREDKEEGRWIVKTKHNSNSWEVIVEPNSLGKSLVVITAYRVD